MFLALLPVVVFAMISTKALSTYEGHAVPIERRGSIRNGVRGILPVVTVPEQGLQSAPKNAVGTVVRRSRPASLKLAVVPWMEFGSRASGVLGARRVGMVREF